MKKRNGSKSGTKRNRRKSDYVVDNPNSSELGMLDRIKLSPRIHRSDEQLIAKVNGVLSPVELHSETVSCILLEPEDSMFSKTEHQLMSELPPVLTNTLTQLTDSTLEMTAIAHADELLEMNACNNDNLESEYRDEQEQYGMETAHLAELAIISEYIEPNSITDYHLQSESVTTDALQDGVVTSDKLAYGAVESLHIQEEAVQTAYLVDSAVTADKLAGDSVGSEYVRAGSIFKKHLGFTPVRVMSEPSPSLQFGTTSFTFEHQDQRELEINVLFTSSYEKADYSFVCTPNLYGTCAVIREQYDDGVVVRVVRELNSFDDSTAPMSVSGALSWIVVG